MGLVYFALYHVTVAVASKVMHVAVTDSCFVINAVIAAHCQQFQILLLVSLMLSESNEKWHRHQLQPQHHNAAE